MDDSTRELTPAADGPLDRTPSVPTAPVRGEDRPAAASGAADRSGAAGGPVGASRFRNEAIPESPPPSGTDPEGSLPATRNTRAWARAQLANWRLYLVLFLSSALSVVLAVLVVPGLGFVDWQRGQFLLIGIVFGLLNAVVKPALHFVALRFIFSTYGVVVVLINAVLLALLAQIMDNVLESSGVLPVLVGGLLVGVLGLSLETVLGASEPVLDRDYKERNGLA